MAADWFFKQHEFVIRAGTLRWIDEARDAAPLVLADVQIVIRNGLREHDVRIDATPPAGWGERFSVRGRFVQPLFAPQQRLAALERARLCRSAARRLERAAPPRHLAVRADRRRRRAARLVRPQGRPADGRFARRRPARGRAAPRQERRAARVRAGRGTHRRRQDRRSHERRGARLRLSHRRRTDLAAKRPARRVAPGRDRRDQRRRVRRRAARHRHDRRDRDPRADRQRSARAARRRASARRDHAAAARAGTGRSTHPSITT